MDGDFSIIVDTGPIGRRSDISPWVGLRHGRVETLFDECLELPLDGWSATVGSNVGYLLRGNYQTWDGIDNVDVALDAIVGAENLLMPYASLPRLPELFSEEFPGTRAPLWFYRLILIHALQGINDEVERWFQVAEELECRHNELCEQFRRFKRNFDRLAT